MVRSERECVCVPFVGSGFAHHTRRNTTTKYTKYTKSAGCRGGERLGEWGVAPVP